MSGVLENSFLTDPLGYIFGRSQGSPRSDAAPASPYHIAAPINTTAVIGYALAAGVIIYVARKLI